MRILQEAGDTLAHPREASLFRANELSLAVLTITSKVILFVLSVLVVLRPLFPDLLSNHVLK